MTKAEMEVLNKLERKVHDIYTALLGIPNTSDNGLCGEFEKITKDVNDNTDRSKGNRVRIAGLYGITVIIITVILHLLGLY